MSDIEKLEAMLQGFIERQEKANLMILGELKKLHDVLRRANDKKDHQHCNEYDEGR